MDAVEKQIRMVRQNRCRPVGQCTLRGCALGSGDLDDAGIPAHGRRTEHGHPRRLGRAIDGHCIGKRGGHRFVEEEWLSARGDPARLLKVRSAIDAEDHHRIHLRANLLKAVVDAHAKGVAQERGVAGHTLRALRQIRTATREGGDNASTRHMVWIGGIVQPQGELFAVGGIEANEAHAEGVSHGGAGQGKGAGHRPQDGDG